MRIYENILMFYKTFNLKLYNVTYRFQRKSLYADRLLVMFSEMTYLVTPFFWFILFELIFNF